MCSPSPGGRSLRSGVAGLVLLDCEGASVPCLLASGVPGSPCVPWLVDASPRSLPPSSHGLPVCLRPRVPYSRKDPGPWTRAPSPAGLIPASYIRPALLPCWPFPVPGALNLGDTVRPRALRRRLWWACLPAVTPPSLHLSRGLPGQGLLPRRQAAVPLAAVSCPGALKRPPRRGLGSVLGLFRGFVSSPETCWAPASCGGCLCPCVLVSWGPSHGLALPLPQCPSLLPPGAQAVTSPPPGGLSLYPRNPTERAHWVPEPHMASTPLPALPLLRPPLPPVVCSQKAGWGRRHRARGPAPVRARPALTDGVVAPMREDMSLVPNRTWCGDCPWGLRSGPVLGRLTLQRLWPPTSRPRWVPQTGCCCWLGLASKHGALGWPPPSWGFTVTLAHLPSTHSSWSLPESPAGRWASAGVQAACAPLGAPAMSIRAQPSTRAADGWPWGPHLLRLVFGPVLSISIFLLKIEHLPSLWKT